MKKQFLKFFNLFTVVALALAIVLTVFSLVPLEKAEAAWDGTAATSFSSGTGTEADPYLIKTAAQLGYFMDQLASGVTYEGQYIALYADLDMTGGTWESSGTFQGTLDGRGYTITADCAFLYTIGESGTVRGLNYLCNTTVSRRAIFCLNNYGSIISCVVKGDTTDSGSEPATTVGHLCNVNYATGTVQNCGSIGSSYAKGDDCDAESGMIANNYGVIDNCYSAVAADASAPGRYNTAYAGPIVGRNYSTGTVTNCIYDNEAYTYSTTYGYGMTTAQMKSTEALNCLLGNPPAYCNWVIDSAFDGYPHLTHTTQNYRAYVTGYQDVDVVNYTGASISVTLSKTGGTTIYYTLDATETDPANFTKYTSGKTLTLTGDAVITMAVYASSKFHVVTRQYFYSTVGSGTEADPYQISTNRQLTLLSQYPDAYFELTADLTFTDADYTASGAAPGGWTSVDTFNGVLDGNGHSITGLKGKVGGLINVNNGTVQNLRMLEHELLAGPADSGAIANDNYGTVTRCYTKSAYTTSSLPSVSNPSNGRYVGGVVGDNKTGGTVSYCRNDGIVAITGGSSTSSFCLGGVVGNGAVSNSVNTGAVILKNGSSINYANVGGITGGGRTENCLSTGQIIVSAYANYGLWIGGVNATDGYPSGITVNCVGAYDVTLSTGSMSPSYIHKYQFGSYPTDCYDLSVSQLPADCAALDFDSTWWVSNEGLIPQGVMDADGHCWSLTSGGQILPTCRANGDAWVKCDLCGKTDVLTIYAIGHRYTNYVSNGDATCTADGTKTASCDRACGYTSTVADEGSMLEHTPVTDAAVAPTCTETGLTEGSHCSKCQTVLTAQEEVAAQGHSWTEATCTEPKTCSACGGTEGEALGHTWTDATCTEPKTCSVCGGTEGEALGHCWTNATCTEPKTCSVCGGTEGDALGHAWSDWMELVSASCTEDGLQARICGTCSETETGAIEATGHAWTDWAETKAPSCTEDGEESRSCACGETETRSVEATGHSYEAVVTGPTCTAEGYTTHTCGTCGDSYTDSYVDAAGHAWTDWAETKAPTCTEDGEQSRSCACGETETRNVEATGHSYEAVVTGPTCTAEGYTTYTCGSCGDVTVGDYVEATGHTWSDWTQTVAPTCTAEGEQTRSCACGATQTQTVAANGHTWGTWIQTKAATCTAEGSRVHLCSACLTKETEAIPMLDHSYVDGVCGSCGAKEAAAKLDSASMSLGDDLRVKFYVAVNESVAADAYVQIAVGQEEAAAVKVSDAQTDGNGCYIFTADVAAPQMMDTITLSLVVGEETSQVCTYSVREYADAVLADESLSGYHALVKAMLNYGAAAQLYFDHNTDALANDGVTVEEVRMPETAPTQVAVSGDRADGIQFYGSTLVFGSRTAVRYYFDVTGEITDYTFCVGETSCEAVEKDGLWYVEVPGVDPQELDEAVTLTVSDGTNTFTVTYSPMNYIVKMYQGNSTDTLKTLLQALYGYYLAAEAYTAA